ncbi:Pathogen-associated molecular patterns-induced protein A70 [Linum perenne]
MASSLSQIQTDDVINDDVITGGGYYSLPLPTTPTAVPAAAASLSLFNKPSRLSRPQLDTCLARVEPPAAAASAAAEVGTKKMRKSASVKCTEVVALTAAAKEEEVRLEKRRPATVRLQKTVSIGDECGGVDSKADDFINRFKEQLKLQRVDSLLRRKELVKARAMQARGLKTY